jgi:hypothetical protein
VCIYKFLYLYLGPSDLQSLQVWVKWWPELEREVRQAIKPEMKSVYDSRYACIFVCTHACKSVQSSVCAGICMDTVNRMQVSIYCTCCTYIICIRILIACVCVFVCKGFVLFVGFPLSYIQLCGSKFFMTRVVIKHLDP